MAEPIAGKVVLVTGAARRIGRAIALELGRAGARVAVHYRGSAEEAEQTAAECGGQASAERRVGQRRRKRVVRLPPDRQ